MTTCVLHDKLRALDLEVLLSVAVVGGDAGYAGCCECQACAGGSCGREYLVHQGNSPSDAMKKLEKY